MEREMHWDSMKSNPEKTRKERLLEERNLLEGRIKSLVHQIEEIQKENIFLRGLDIIRTVPNIQKEIEKVQQELKDVRDGLEEFRTFLDESEDDSLDEEIGSKET